MVIAMPVQGLAASLMLFCGPNHERMPQGLVLEAPGFEQGRAHDDGHHLVAPDAVAGTEDDGAPSPLSHHDKFSCSACAACCSVLALPAQFVSLPVEDPAYPMGLSPGSPIASHQPDGLYRPPRYHLA